MAKINGNVLSCVKRDIKDGDQVSHFYEIAVDFGDGVVICSSGKEVKSGFHDFTISPRSMYDRKARVTPVLDIAPGKF